MRKQRFNLVRTRASDFSSKKADIDDAARALADYLAHVPGERGKTKHATMGPVGKILKRVVDGNVSDLVGYAVHVQEMAGDRAREIRPDGFEALQRGVTLLTNLVKDDADPTVRARIIERVDYATFYFRKRAILKRFETVQTLFNEFAARKYGSLEASLSKWADALRGQNIPKGRLPYPTKKRGEAKNILGDDVREFWQGQKGLGAGEAIEATADDLAADVEEEVTA